MKNMFLNRTLLAFTLALAVGYSVIAGEMNHGGSEEWNRPWNAQDDAAFLFGMIAHHQGAIDMAQPAVNSSDPQVANWAADIISVQRIEIAAMETLAGTLGLRDEDNAGSDMRNDMAEMMRGAKSGNADIDFIAMMIPHHAIAVDMSLPALVESHNEEVRRLARDIIATQAREIFEFRHWLNQRKPE